MSAVIAHSARSPNSSAFSPATHLLADLLTRLQPDCAMLVKDQDLRAVKARTREALEVAIKQALATATESETRAWFAHYG